MCARCVPLSGGRCSFQFASVHSDDFAEYFRGVSVHCVLLMLLCWQVNNVYRAFNDRLRIIPAPDAKERVPLGGSMAPNLAEEGRAAKAKHSARRKSKSPGKSFPVS